VSSANPIRTRLRGGLLVAAAILFQALWLGLPALAVSVLLALTYVVWIGSRWRVRPGLRSAAALGVLAFVAHFVEELRTGLAIQLPALFGREGWSETRFLVFNLVFALLFAFGAVAVDRTRPVAALVVLFLGVGAGVANGALHLALVVARGGYFPGAWTAPLCFAAGASILRSLYRGTPSDVAAV